MNVRQIDEPDTPFAYGGVEDGLEEVSVDVTSLDAPLQSDVTVNRQIPNNDPPNLGLGGGGGSGGAGPTSLWETLEGKLETAALAADAGELLVGAEAMDAGIAAEEKKKAFAAKRSAHYNEFQRVQEMRARMAAGEGDDDDDECED